MTPEPDLSLPIFADEVNENVQQYYRYNHLKTFFSLRPYRVNFTPTLDPADDDGSAVMTWLEKTTITSKVTK